MIFSGFCGLKFCFAASRRPRLNGTFKNFIGLEFKQRKSSRGFKFNAWPAGSALWSR